MLKSNFLRPLAQGDFIDSIEESVTEIIINEDDELQHQKLKFSAVLQQHIEQAVSITLKMVRDKMEAGVWNKSNISTLLSRVDGLLVKLTKYEEAAKYPCFHNGLKTIREDVSLMYGSVLITRTKQLTFTLGNKSFYSRISILRNGLIKDKYIHPETTLPQLRAIFESKDRVSIDKINWIGTRGELFYFIRGLLSIQIEGPKGKESFIQPPKKGDKWKITSNCFLLNGANAIFATQDSPSEPTVSSKKLLNSIIDILSS